MRIHFCPSFVLLFAISSFVQAAPRVLDDKLHHLRVGNEREWAEFPEQAEGDALTVAFDAEPNTQPGCVRLRLIDVRHRWNVSLNGKKLGDLGHDENAMLAYFAVPTGALKAKNTLAIASTSKKPDDIRVGDIQLFDQPIDKVLNEATVTVSVMETKADGKNVSVPARVTVVDEQGALVPVGAKSNDSLAVRTGFVYTKNGRATFGLPAGKYTLYATRGFEYSLATQAITLKVDDKRAVYLEIKREVDTTGYVACDTHVHTLTHSRHGDATMEERMITLAGEGIELPIATDHNIHIDYEKVAQATGTRRYFTPVIGNEVTTAVGHFNVFPAVSGSRPPDWRVPKWETIYRNIYATPGVRVAIMNHPRNVHSNFQPMNAKNQLAVVGVNLDGWKVEANAMELVNSAALQSDPMLVIHDWFALLNRGHHITAIGSSDSHEVAYKIVGQGRTYIKCDDSDPSKIDVKQAVDHLLAGKVNVSMGLLCEINVDGKFEPGDLAKVGKASVATLTVKGPSWTKANALELYANGVRIKSFEHELIRASRVDAIKMREVVTLPAFKHDVTLVAVARGPGVKRNFWRIAKPYQPASKEWQSYVIGVTGVIHVDADGDGKFTCAYDYAKQILADAKGDLVAIIATLSDYDEAVAAQVAYELRRDGTLNDSAASQKELQRVLTHASVATLRGFKRFDEAWAKSNAARSGN